MRLWKSAFDCSSGRSFSAARSGSFQTTGAVDQKAVLSASGQQLLAVRRERQGFHASQFDVAEIQLHQFAPRLDIPEADRLVTAACRQGASIRRKHHGTDRTGMPLERFQEFSGGDVPELHGSLATGQGQGLAVRRKGHILDHARLRILSEYIESRSAFRSVCVAFQVSVDQRIAVPSRLPLASRAPSLEKSRETQ